MSPSNGLFNGGGGRGGNGRNYMEHQVSKLDTLAGVAIKYGVEVADIKRMNGLATDLQMFAMKTLRIPLPGRHPPSPCLSNGHANLRENSSERKPPHLGQSNMFESFQSLRCKAPQRKASQAMNTLQNYYGIKSSKLKGTDKGTEMAVYRTGSTDDFHDDWLPRGSPMSDSPSNHHHKSRNLVNGFVTENGHMPEYKRLSEHGVGEGEKSDEKSVRRRQKSEVDSGAGTLERLFGEENSGESSGFSASTGKAAMRAKSASRAMLLAESESAWLDSIPVGLGESILTDGLARVRKSSSASSLRDQDKNNSSTVWPATMWSFKPDLQGLSTAAITKPIFNGIPIPITGRRGKAALD
ncbi:LysM and putative peptidoglycan-binding domain-containing protein [Quillaja saponaria]|uniref:LysM and putative peptidoglycan-binding domain-containing protein n=1 Tax=Quillaja saponaria TaxID=32244 RepID=A0AAD7Q5X0_QUISA|nr:LysM and putative peptidoglycan-binding domain-containing protein [Quillaja saponaria]